MALNAKNWTLNSYTVNVWKTLVLAGTETMVKNVVFSVGANPATMHVRVLDSFGNVAQTLVPGELLDPNRGYKLDLDLIVLEASQRLQVRTDVTGVSYSANGIEKGTGVWAATDAEIPAITASGTVILPTFSGTPSIPAITAAGTATVV